MKQTRVSAIVTVLVASSFLTFGGGEDTLHADSSPVSQVYTFPLAKLMSVGGPISLRNTVSDYTIFLPLAERLQVRSAVLHLEFTNSTAVLAERSQLQILLNEKVIAQVPLKGSQPEGTLDVRLPAQLFAHDYNRLLFRAVLHYMLECEDPNAPELWLQIDSVASTVSVEVELRALTPRLSDIDELFDRKWWGQHGLHILTGSTPIRDAHLRWGALIAQGAALRLEYVPLQVTHGVATRQERSITDTPAPTFPFLDQRTLAGTDTVLIGTTEELVPYLSQDTVAQITNSYLAVHRLDTDPAHFLLVVSGKDDAEVTRAATAFAFLNFPFPEATSMQITEAQFPSPPAYTLKQGMRENQAYQLADLGFHTATAHGMHPDGFRLELNVPPDLFAPEDAVVELSLHMAYSAGLRHDSVLNIQLNDIFEAAIPLNDPNGGVFRAYKIAIPLRSFRAGHNVITFSPRPMPLVTGKCFFLQSGNLLVTLFDDSTLTVPAASHYTRLPNLQIFATTAFPYNVLPDGSSFALQVSGQESGTVAAAWMLIAKLAQKASMPLYKAELSLAVPTGEKDLIVVSPVDQVDDRLMAAAPMSLAPPYRVPYPTRVTLPPSAPHPTFLGRLKAMFVGPVGDAGTPTPQQPVIAQVTQESELGQKKAVMMFESPLHAKKTVVLFVAANALQLQQGMNRLVEPEFWENLRGDLVVWDDRPSSLAWQKAGPDYHVGKINFTPRVEYYFSHYPWLWVTSLLVLIGVFAIFTRIGLSRFKRKHHGEAVDSEIDR